MKKMLLVGAFALGLTALSERPAHAWVNSKFGVGLNWHMQSGGNNFLWGVFRNGQVPGPEAFHQGGPYTPPGYQSGPQGFPYYGAAPMSPAPATAEPPQAPQNQNMNAGYYQPNYFHNASYVPASSYVPSYYYQPTWNYYGW